MGLNSVYGILLGRSFPIPCYYEKRKQHDQRTLLPVFCYAVLFGCPLRGAFYGSNHFSAVGSSAVQASSAAAGAASGAGTLCPAARWAK